MNKIVLAYLLLCVLLAGCRSTFDNRLVLNQQSQVYEARHGGKTIPIRLNSGELVNESNLETFEHEQTARGNHYPFSLRKEPSVLLKRSDWSLTSRFDAIHSAITNQLYNEVFALARDIRSIYPQADLYSNLAFLEGYAFEQLGIVQEAKKSYSQFLAFSNQTFSALQRGYEQADPSDSIYLEQRNAARQFVNGNRAMHVFEFLPIPPKHHVVPNQPGFIENTSFSDSKRCKPGVSIGRDYCDALSLGLRLSRPMSDKIRFVLFSEISQHEVKGTLGLPLQLFRTPSNNFGVKLAPFLTYSYRFDLPRDADFGSSQRGKLDVGIQLSSGLFLMPNLLVGGYYKGMESPGSPGTTSHYYDLSAYWNIFENLSLKAGVKKEADIRKHDLIIGCFLSGWEIAWSLNNHRLILTTDLF